KSSACPAAPVADLPWHRSSLALSVLHHPGTGQNARHRVSEHAPPVSDQRLAAFCFEIKHHETPRIYPVGRHSAQPPQLAEQADALGGGGLCIPATPYRQTVPAVGSGPHSLFDSRGTHSRQIRQLEREPSQDRVSEHSPPRRGHSAGSARPPRYIAPVVRRRICPEPFSYAVDGLSQ